MKERSGNVIENKGTLWKTRDEAGMYLKTDDADQSSTETQEVRKQRKAQYQLSPSLLALAGFGRATYS
jgi:hypothetical protein